jgi:hypothetical protein
MAVRESGTEIRKEGSLSTEDGVAGEVRPHALSLGTYLATSRTAVAAVTLSVVAMFIPVATVPYGQIDDYAFLWMAVSGHPDPFAGRSIFETSAVQARPLEGLLQAWGFAAAGSIDHLRVLRILGLVGIAAFGVLLHWALVRSGFRSWFAALIAVLICSLPAFEVYAAVTVAFPTPCAAVLAGAASLVAATAIDLPPKFRGSRLALSGAMLLAAILIYPPPAMFFWVFLAIAVIGARYEAQRTKRLVWAHLGAAGVAFGSTWVITKIAIHVYGTNSPNAERSTLVHDFGGKLRWFFGWRSTHETGLSIHDPLYGALSLFELTPSPWFSGLVAIVALGGILALLLRERLSILLYGGIALLLVPLSFLPSLVVAENSPGYRVQAAMTALIALYFAVGAYGLWLALRDSLRPRLSGREMAGLGVLAMTAAVAFVGFSAYSANRNVTTLIVVPQSTELRLVRSQLARVPAGTQRLAFVETGNDQSMAPFTSVDEFGVPSSARPWVPRPFALLILHEQGKLSVDQPEPIVDVLPPTTKTYPKNEPVIDVRELRALR